MTIHVKTYLAARGSPTVTYPSYPIQYLSCLRLFAFHLYVSHRSLASRNQRGNDGGPHCYVFERELYPNLDMLQHIEHATCKSGLNSGRIRIPALDLNYCGNFADDCDPYLPMKPNISSLCARLSSCTIRLSYAPLHSPWRS